MYSILAGWRQMGADWKAPQRKKRAFVFQSMGNWKEYDWKIDEMTSVEEDKCHQFSHFQKRCIQSN